MEVRMKKALESVLFFDETTPVEELIDRYANEPLHLRGEEGALLAGPDSIFSLWRQTQSYSRACPCRVLCCACRAASTAFL